jgi:hypothetical protein
MMSSRIYWRNIRLDPIMMDKNTSIEQLFLFTWVKIRQTDKNLSSKFESGIGQSRKFK